MKKKWHEYVGIRQAVIGGIVAVLVAGMYIWNSRSQLAQDNATLKTENSAHVKTIKSKDAIIADLNQRLANKDSEIQRLETQLTPFRTIALEKYTGSEQESLKKLADEIQELKNPLKQIIASATSHIEATISSDLPRSYTYENVGGYLAFVKDRHPLLMTTGKQSEARPNGKGEVTYKGDFAIDQGQSAVGKPVEVLQACDLIQMNLGMIPADSQILRGTASVVINGDTRFEFEIPPQQTRNGVFLIRDVKQGFLRNR